MSSHELWDGNEGWCERVMSINFRICPKSIFTCIYILDKACHLCNLVNTALLKSESQYFLLNSASKNVVAVIVNTNLDSFSAMNIGDKNWDSICAWLKQVF